jgi:EpsI family protein
MVKFLPKGLMPDFRRASVIFIILATASFAAQILQPVQQVSLEGSRLDLNELLPDHFLEWSIEKDHLTFARAQVQSNKSEKLYSQTVGATYINQRGERIMLSIAYGANQLADRLHAHRPEYCYRAQGFVVSGEADENLTVFGALPVRRLYASLNNRKEPITYWMTIGDQAVLPGWSRKLAQIQHGLRGSIPDGLLIRISSIESNARIGYATHDSFINDWLNSLPPDRRQQLTGKS